MQKLKVTLPKPQPESASSTPPEEGRWSRSELEAQLQKARAESRKKIDDENIFMLPSRYKGKTLGHLINAQEAVTMALKAVQQGKSLTVTGATGTGKTHLAVGMMREWYLLNIKAGEDDIMGRDMIIYPGRPILLPAVELVLELQAGFDREKPQTEIVEKYAVAPFLVLDDLGAEKVTDWTRQMMYTLVDRRYRYSRPTVITTNLTLEELADTIDRRIVSRLSEMGLVIDMKGKDFRVHGRVE